MPLDAHSGGHSISGENTPFFMSQNGAAEKTKVAVLWTGGTIGSVQEMQGNKKVSKPGLTGKQFEDRFLTRNFRKANGIEAIEWIPLMDERPKGIDSTEMTNDLMERIAEKIHGLLRDPKFKHHRIVVTHGTDTLEQSAAYTSFALQGLDRPVVFTGAQIAPGVVNSDAVNNFGLAVQAADINTGQVLVAFGDKVMRGVAVAKQDGVKTQTTFGSPHQHFVAELTGPHLNPDPSMLKTPSNDLACLKHLPGLGGEVFISRFTPNLNDSRRIRKVLDDDYDAVILEGYAAGNIPTNISRIISEASNRMMVIITPSTATHGAYESLYEGSAEIGHPTAHHFVGPSHVALTKFQWLFERGRALGLKNIGQHRALDLWIKERFSCNFVGESVREQVKSDVPLDLYLHTKTHIGVFRRKFASQARIAIGKGDVDKGAKVAAMHGSKLFAVEHQIRGEWLDRRADMLVGCGLLDEARVDEWKAQREHIVDIPVDWITNAVPPPPNDLLYKFYLSEFIDAQHKPIPQQGGGYIFSPFTHRFFEMKAEDGAAKGDGTM